MSSIHLHSWGPIQSSSLQTCGKCVFLATELWLLWDRQLGIYGNRSFKYPKHCSMDRRSSFLKGSRARHLFWGWNESTIGLWRKPHIEKMDGGHSVQVWWFVRPWEYKATVSSVGSLWFFSPLNWELLGFFPAFSSKIIFFSWYKMIQERTGVWNSPVKHLPNTPSPDWRGEKSRMTHGHDCPP